MNKITIFDTSIVTENIGDFIIMDSVNRELKEIFHKAIMFYSLTHGKVDKATYHLNRISDYSFIGGTNLLSSNMNKYNQWKINLFDTIFLNNIILMGVGWWQYQNKPNLYTQFLLKSVLNKNILHSVRDSYTEKMLKSIGINNVINTGCPTMWQLTKKHCINISNNKAEDVVFTLTDYNKDLSKDQELINILIKNYKNIYFWPQGSYDDIYLKSLKNIDNITILGGGLDSYDNLLVNNEINLDFIGTRLHAGIRALQKLRRTIILGIDNRAEEKAKDFHLMVLPRNEIHKLNKLISQPFATKIKLKEDNIQKWKNQF